MKIVLILLVLFVLLLLVAVAYVRLAPTDAARWHGDPLTAPLDDKGGWVVRPEGGQAAAPVWAAEPEQALAAFAAVADAAPRTQVVAGSVESGHMTWVQRSKLWGFPDFISVKALPAPGGATLAIWSRQRFGQADMGVNRTRVDGWLGQIDLPRAP